MKFYPSSADRWLACPGSAPLSDGAPYTPSVYAAEGTVAHSVAEDCLRLGFDPAEFLGEKRSADGFEFEVDQVMVEALREYIEIVEAIPGKAFFERRLKAQLRGGVISGRADVFKIEEQGLTLWLHFVDLKYGQGVAVSARDNPQLKTYASLLLNELRERGDLKSSEVSGVSAAIVQPRAATGEKFSRVEYSVDELETHAREVQKAVDLAVEAKAFVGTPKILDYLSPGDHCRWCPIKATCPKLHAEAQAEAKKDFGQIPLLEAPDMLSKERLLWWLENAKTFEDFISAIRDHAKQRLDRGEELPGWKLVESIANRRWNGDETEIEKALRKKGAKKKDLFESRFIGPADAEKLLGALLPKGEAKAVVDELTIRPVTGVSLVPETDKRPAVNRRPAEQDFAAIE